MKFKPFTHNNQALLNAMHELGANVAKIVHGQKSTEVSLKVTSETKFDKEASAKLLKVVEGIHGVDEVEFEKSVLTIQFNPSVLGIRKLIQQVDEVSPS